MELFFWPILACQALQLSPLQTSERTFEDPKKDLLPVPLCALFLVSSGACGCTVRFVNLRQNCHCRVSAFDDMGDFGLLLLIAACTASQAPQHRRRDRLRRRVAQDRLVEGCFFDSMCTVARGACASCSASQCVGMDGGVEAHCGKRS